VRPHAGRTSRWGSRGVLTVFMYKASFFFAVQSEFYSTQYVLQQIEDLGLLVKVAFVGDALLEVVRHLEQHSKAVMEGRK